MAKSEHDKNSRPGAMAPEEKQLRRHARLEVHIHQTRTLIAEQRKRVESGHTVDNTESQALLASLEESLMALLNFRRVTLMGNGRAR
jgi:hypothetical protein